MCMAKKNIFQGLLDRITKNQDTPRSGEELLENQQEAEPLPEPIPNPSILDVADDGALTRLWQRWAGDIMFPTLSLINEEFGCKLNLNEQSLQKECVRLSRWLEQEAKKRLRTLDEAKKKETYIDASCLAYSSVDGLAAWIFLFPPSDEGGQLHVDAIGKALKNGSITTGIDSSVVARLFKEKPYFRLIPVACGTQVTEGEDGRVEERFPREISQEVKVDESGMADYRSVNYVQMVNQGDILCDIIPPKPGQPGLRVDGKVIEPRAVKPAKVPSGSNTTISEDGLHLLATREGHLEYSSGVFQVRPLLEIKGDVDYSIGNIDFRGDVHIHGDVRGNFVVRATGTITIDGLVEAASVEAGGDLIITCGVLGDNKALIKSGGSIRAKYLESCIAYAGKCIFADCIMSSQVFSDDSISVTNGRGTVIGGAMTAARAIKVGMIGSQSGRRTEITLGVLPYVQEKLRNDQASLEIIRQEMETLERELRYLEAQHGIEGSSEKLAKAHLRKSVLAMKESQLVKRRETLEDMTPDLSKCRLECNMVYPVTCVTIQNSIWRTEVVKRRCILSFDTQIGEIKEV